MDSGCDLKDCADWLEKYNRHHALATLYKYHGESDKALSLWTRYGIFKTEILINKDNLFKS